MVILLKILSLDFFFFLTGRQECLNCFIEMVISEWIVFLHKGSYLELVMSKLMQHLLSLSQIASLLIFQDFYEI